MEKQHRGAEFGCRAPQESPMDAFAPMDCILGSPLSDDLFSLSALLSLENYPEICSPTGNGQLFSPFSYANSPFSYSSFEQIPNSWPSLQSPNGSSDVSSFDGINQAQRANSQALDSNQRMSTSVIPKSIGGGGVSLADRMLSALSLLKYSSSGGILAQVWMPIKHGNKYVLSTSDQPFLLDQILAGYREISRKFTFSAAETLGTSPGLPGRVYISGMPEWTSNVLYYNKCEYLRMEYAISHEVRGSLAVPVFDPKEGSCCAVLELVTTKEKLDFDIEMESVCDALQAVDLNTIKAQPYQQTLTKNQKSAFSEILDILRACCHAHMLPLALTWVPFSYEGDHLASTTRNPNSSLRQKSKLHIQESACYVNDSIDNKMNGFLHACSEHCLENGQGIAGKALQSNHPFFSPDVKGYDIREYPLAHHARKYGLNAAVAIRLRSTYTGNDDYILELFLPVNCRGSSEQQELLNNLSSTMQRICRSLRLVSEVEVGVGDPSKVDIHKQLWTNSSSSELSAKNIDNEVSTDLALEDPSTDLGEREDAYHEQFKSDSTRQPQKKRSTAEKNISLSILQQYFSGSLKDAAKSIGVCPTTLKRICRQQGISRWPSRKINKVNRSLKKIQNVINSVQGVEGSLKYDPTTGCLVAAVSPSEKKNLMMTTKNQEVTPLFSTPHIESKKFVRKVEFGNKLETLHFCNPHNASATGELNSKDTLQKSYIAKDDTDTKVELDVAKEHSRPSSSSMTDSSSGSASSFPTFKKGLTDKVLPADSTTTVTVKATYKEDTVRFKFTPSMGCHQLFEEIGMRHKLPTGTFQLKYMDDEDEWVMLESDSDLNESLEVLQSLGSRNLKLLVRDVPFAMGSSGGSNW